MSNTKLFVTGIGTDVGKTLVSAILTEALHADYWKPVQAGFEDGTDSEWIRRMITNKKSVIHPEVYRLKLAASPHIAAREENIRIDINKIISSLPDVSNSLVIEGAGGLMVPLNENEFVSDLVRTLNIKVVLVSRNTLGSINHSLLTAIACRQQGIDIAGWVFNDNYLHYEDDIVKWSGFPKLASIPHCRHPDAAFIAEQAAGIRKHLDSWLC